MENYIPKLRKLGFSIIQEGNEGVIRTSNGLSIGKYQILENPPIRIFLDTGDNKILEEELNSIEMLQENKIPYTPLSKELIIQELTKDLPETKNLLEKIKRIKD